jgi:hypothetical protein
MKARKSLKVICISSFRRAHAQPVAELLQELPLEDWEDLPVATMREYRKREKLQELYGRSLTWQEYFLLEKKTV